MEPMDNPIIAHFILIIGGIIIIEKGGLSCIDENRWRAWWRMG